MSKKQFEGVEKSSNKVIKQFTGGALTNINIFIVSTLKNSM